VKMSVLSVSYPWLYLSQVLEPPANPVRFKLSFAGVEDVPSSFINSALVPFVLENGVDWVKANLAIIRARKQIIDMIRLCFANAERSLIAA
jgi:hypothetical protein